MAFSKCFFLLALLVAVSFSNMETGMAARQLLQLPNLPTTLPPLPQPTALPKPTLPSGGLPPLPAMPTIPTIPSTIPKVAQPPLPSNLPTFPNIPSIPGLTIPSIPGLTPAGPGN